MSNSSIIENTKSIKKILFYLIPISFVLGALVMYILSNILNHQSNTSDFYMKDASLQKRYRAIGGPVSKKEAADYVEELYKYIKIKEPMQSDFDATYTAGVSFTAHELWNYFDVLRKDNPTATSSDLKVYLCLARYPKDKLDPNNKPVGNRLTVCLVAEKAPFSLIKKGVARINTEKNPNCLSAFNWGDLEP